MADALVFTLESANAILPKLRERVKRQVEEHAHIETDLRALGASDGVELEPSDSDELRAKKLTLIQRIESYRAEWKSIEALGPVVKDPRIGLLDFYGNIDGHAVWLCWKNGEPEIAHYHGLDEGYSARKPIRTSTRQRLLN